ncbi:hypothetical protein IFM89_009676 [Coptis chinensis]|uniref:Zinc finger PMZ-type domain-containing protein n=1 Tax=Coptis chinensis TaxID=261450 RepID=A0A835IMD2_9MAGN|nr:hypothetical protein IFM89_009676 [Coptis chinensis]
MVIMLKGLESKRGDQDCRKARYCFRHMYKNFKKVFSGELWENLAWGATKAYKQQELTRILGVINKTDSKALNWELSMSLMTGDVVPNVLFMIKMRELRYNWYEIKGMPCAHVVAVLKSRRPQWERYCSPYFNMEAFRATYATYLYPIDNIEDWPEIDNIEELVLPPKNTRKAGRSKKQRIRGEDEPLKSHRKCAKCGTPGHNTLTCDARKKGVHGKRRKPQDQGAQYHNEAAAAQAVPAAPPMQPTPDLPEPSNKRRRKIRNAPLQEETPAALTQGGRHRALGPDEVQHDAAPAQAQGGRGRAPGQDEVQYDAAPAQTQRGRGRNRRSRGGNVP